MSWWERIGRRFAMLCLITVAILFWSIPSAIVALVSNVSFPGRDPIPDLDQRPSRAHIKLSAGLHSTRSPVFVYGPRAPHAPRYAHLAICFEGVTANLAKAVPRSPVCLQACSWSCSARKGTLHSKSCRFSSSRPLRKQRRVPSSRSSRTRLAPG